MTSVDRVENPETGPRVKVISRVGQILRVLSAEPAGLALPDVVERTRLPKSTAYRLLLALVQEDLVATVDGRFRIGWGLAGAGVSWHEQLRQRVRPLMESLAVRVRETVDLGVLVGDQIMFVEQVQWQRELTVGARLGELYPALASACGKALLAASPEHQRVALAARGADPPAQGLEPAAVVAELALAAEEKLAYDREGFHPGVAGVATYAHTRSGSPVALGVVLSSARIDDKAALIRDELLAVRGELERVLAGT